VIFTSEFDLTRRDAYAFKESLEKVRKLLDFHDMPQVHHGYHLNPQMDEAAWFFKESRKAFDKYVKT